MEPVDEPRAFYVTLEDVESVPLAAVFLSVDGPVEGVRVSGGWGFVHADGPRTHVAVAKSTPTGRLGFTLIVPDAAPTMEVLQVADGDNELFPYPGAFAVELREVEVQP